jgi:hypothetical protein
VVKQSSPDLALQNVQGMFVGSVGSIFGNRDLSFAMDSHRDTRERAMTLKTF